MKQNRLGTSGIVVSEICMGTMTFGKQADKEMSFRILDQSIDAGIDFFDTAEVYPVPPTVEEAGRTESLLGEWMKGRDRNSIILASKVAGAAHGWFNPPVRGGKAALDRVHIRQAVEGSLRRLQTDYIDLYQVHWPDHGMRPEDTLEVLDELVQEGKVRTIGISNEDSYGLMKALWASDVSGFARYDTIQNNFSVIHRRCEDELAEVCRREQVSLLPYSPLAGGVVSGKYNDGQLPEGARFSAYLKNGAPRQRRMAERFVNPKSLETTARLVEIAKEADMDVVTLATAWSKQHDYVASTIVGVSHEDQLAPIFAAADLELSDEVLKKIDEVSAELLYPMGTLLGA
ncbi:aldo/keto reductase [Verrucomicrobiaceae bacterium N1E253]|uniref:Aldo/keto reductase n=1 Tax=Oceaniferula marina TaxID=2748318 RepID=A0A851GJE0_9BACT|nr:aldo/keto reductase [Oceaniferula marina]NWK57289.1 aldo/keto reductase [Oceaniferula marina]